MMKYLVFGLFTMILLWLAGEGDKRVQKRYADIRQIESYQPIETGESLEALRQEGD